MPGDTTPERPHIEEESVQIVLRTVPQNQVRAILKFAETYHWNAVIEELGLQTDASSASAAPTASAE